MSPTTLISRSLFYVYSSVVKPLYLRYILMITEWVTCSHTVARRLVVKGQSPVHIRMRNFAFLTIRGIALLHSDILIIHFWEIPSISANADKHWISCKQTYYDSSCFWGFTSFLGQIWDFFGDFLGTFFSNQ